MSAAASPSALPLARPVPGGLLWLALLLTGLLHGTLMLSRAFLNSDGAGTLLFMASAYRQHPFDPWEPRWYVGMPLTGLPPLAPQLLAALEHALTPTGAYGVLQLLSALLLVVGIYRSSRALGVPADASGLAAVLAGIAAPVAAQLSVFGHLDAVLGAALTMSAVPALRAALDGTGTRRAWWASGFTLLAAGLACPGAALPLGLLIVLALAALDPHGRRRTVRTVGLAALCAVPGVLMLAVTAAWTGPAGVTLRAPSVPAAEGRDVLVTLLVPLAGVLWALPGLWRRARPGRPLDGAVALTRAGAGLAGISALAVLGAAAGHPALVATPPETLLFFGLLLCLPLAGAVGLGLRIGAPGRARAGLMALVVGTALFSVGVHSLGTRRPLEPARIDMQPILNFIEKDEHWRYRFLTVGFGRQLALMSAQTRAGTPSGLLHLPPELPGLTARTRGLAALPERADLPNLGPLAALLTHPERTHLKFVYAKSTLLDPLLHFSGFHPIGAVENGVMVWEREDIPPVPARPARGTLPFPLGVLWGSVPGLALVLGLGMLAWTGPGRTRAARPVLVVAEAHRPVALLVLGVGAVLAGTALRARVVPGQVAMAAVVAGARQVPAGGGLRGEYARLDRVRARARVGDALPVPVAQRWWTPLGYWFDVTDTTLTPTALGWSATTPAPTTALPPPVADTQPTVAFYRSPRRLTTDTTSAADVLDRPVLQVLATRLSRTADGGLTVVGELRNVDARPADTTVTVIMRGPDGTPLVRENAGRLTLHKLRPGERTPFRVDILPPAPGQDVLPPGTPLDRLGVEVAARAVVTGREQDRPLMARSRVRHGQVEVIVTNVGTRTVGVPQALVTLLDARGAAWVHEAIGLRELPPGGTWAFRVPATPPAGTRVLGTVPAQPSAAAPPAGPVPGTFARPGGAYRITLNAFIPEPHP
ncbi:hypothetical protein HNQ07_002402 [Deinococcus metalli]|uniref:Uncharacterized protein n=1 Tax=Deinococcus metalli TaxID=1141878 RepID=A0A7W8NRI9_9DEIO|nr:FxLYD domain-containing protein [Deinococcus metalli]MBB5376938.1 hypothetical protein [Deinococcus metalli]GHF46443.1 hypothetical protein GCM10017781_23650 [Deinococcus metalli]